MSAKIEERIKKINMTPGQMALMGMLILQVIGLFIMNLTMVNVRIDGDSANLFTHMIRMAEEKTYIIPGWLYTTSLEIDCSVLLAMPLYMLTGSIGVSVAISNLIFTLLFIYVWMLILKKESLWVRLLFANLVLIPFRTGMLDYYNMMFFAGGQYQIRILIVSLLIYILLESEESPKIKQYLTLSGLFVVLLFISSLSSGMYVMLMGLFPVTMVYFLIHFISWKKVPVYIWGLGVISALSALCGIMLNNRIFIGERYTLSINYTALPIMYDYPTRAFWGVYELLGAVSYSGELPAMSPEGVFFLFRFVLVSLLYLSVGYSIWRIIRKKASKFEALAVGLIVWNFFVNVVFMTCYSSATFEYRYHIIIVIPAMAILCRHIYALINTLKLPQQKTIVMTALICMLFAVGVYHYGKFIKEEDPNTTAEEISEYCESLGCDQVYVYFSQELSELVRYFSGGRDYTRMLANGHTYIRDYYLDCHDRPIEPTEKSMFVFAVKDLPDFEISTETGGSFDKYELKPLKQIGDYFVFAVNE